MRKVTVTEAHSPQHNRVQLQVSNECPTERTRPATFHLNSPPEMAAQR